MWRCRFFGFRGKRKEHQIWGYVTWSWETPESEQGRWTYILLLNSMVNKQAYLVFLDQASEESMFSRGFVGVCVWHRFRSSLTSSSWCSSLAKVFGRGLFLVLGAFIDMVVGNFGSRNCPVQAVEGLGTCFWGLGVCLGVRDAEGSAPSK